VYDGSSGETLAVDARRGLAQAQHGNQGDE